MFVLTEEVGWAFRVLIAQVLTLILFALNLVSFSLPYAGEMRPFFLLMAIYYWAIYRPTLLPPIAAFALGLGLDILSGFPVGLNALLLLAVQMIVRRNRLFLMGQPYGMVWMGFGLTCLTVAGAQWAFFAMMSQGLPAFEPAGAAALLSVAVFPLVTLFLILAHRMLPSGRR
jgi:rod shape-determining protein MreD